MGMNLQRKSQKQLTPLELRIMQVLWPGGAMTVQAVQQGMDKELAYTTVQTMLNVLERKGHVERKREGRAFVYSPLQSRETASKSAVRDLLDRTFDGSVENLLMNLVNTRQLDAAQLAKLAQRVAEAEGQEDADAR
jgi:predicted transcriptional regulator